MDTPEPTNEPPPGSDLWPAGGRQRASPGGPRYAPTVPRPASQNTVHPLGYAKPRASRLSVRLRGTRDWLREEFRAYQRVAIALVVGTACAVGGLLIYFPRTTAFLVRWLAH